VLPIEWDIVVKILVPLVTLVIGKGLDQWAGKRPRLISYLGHVSSFTLTDPLQTQVYTHAIVVGNTGRAAANNVRIGHHYLPNVQVYPRISYSTHETPGGGAEIVIDKLIPGEQITVSYLYFPPVTWDRINAYTKSDEGFAKILQVIPTPQLSRWALWAIRALLFVGVTSLLYVAVQGMRRLLS
jgi:hypothetical protein